MIGALCVLMDSLCVLMDSRPCAAQHKEDYNIVVACVPQVPASWGFSLALQDSVRQFEGAEVLRALECCRVSVGVL